MIGKIVLYRVVLEQNEVLGWLLICTWPKTVTKHPACI